MSYILFYSDRCNYSKKFINFLERSGESPLFIKKCLDRDPITKQMPTNLIKKYNIKRVPVIIVDGRFLEGENAFKWLNDRIKNSRFQNSPNNSRQDKSMLNNPAIINRRKKQSFDEYLDKKKRIKIFNLNKRKRILGEHNIKPQNVEFFTNKSQERQQINENTGGVALPESIKSLIVNKGDKLRKKQLDNNYAKLMSERENF